jgi:hypothetical protein
MNGRYYDTEIRGKKRFVNVKLTLAATGTVPAGGIPLPTGTKVGMVKNVDYYILRHAETTNFATDRFKALHFVMNTTGKTVKVYRYTMSTGAVASSGGRAMRSATVLALNVSGTNVLYCTAVGW